MKKIGLLSLVLLGLLLMNWQVLYGEVKNQGLKLPENTAIPKPAAGTKDAVKSLKTNEEFLLWPGVAPGSETVKIAEKISSSNNNLRVITGVTKPSLTAFIPEKPNGLSVIILPGGGYRELEFDYEGVEIAKYLNTLGISGFVLKYRLPGEGHENGQSVPLQDAQRAVRFIRSHAVEWGLNPAKVGVMGFSAGGHLAALLATHYNRKVYEMDDAVEQASARPDFAVLVYAGISTEEQVTGETPPTFMVISDDDTVVGTEGNIRYYTALHKAKVPAEMHIFAHGGHGFSNRATGPAKHWTKLFAEWLHEIGK